MEGSLSARCLTQASHFQDQCATTYLNDKNYTFQVSSQEPSASSMSHNFFFTFNQSLHQPNLVQSLSSAELSFLNHAIIMNIVGSISWDPNSSSFIRVSIHLADYYIEYTHTENGCWWTLSWWPLVASKKSWRLIKTKDLLNSQRLNCILTSPLLTPNRVLKFFTDETHSWPIILENTGNICPLFYKGQILSFIG